MYKLLLPEYNFTYKKINNQDYVLDIIRKKYIKLTPEEWVRQHVVHFLIEERNYPKSLIRLEVSMILHGQPKRADIVCYNSQNQAILVVECKAPEVSIKQDVFEQISHYNLELQAPYLLVTNGKKHAMCFIDLEKKTYDFITEIPFYESKF